MKTIANNLIKLRKEKDLSKEKLSKNLSISILDLDGYENDIKIIPPDILIKYAKYFNISIDDICGIKSNATNKYEEFSKKLISCFEKNNINIESLNEKDIDVIIQCTIFITKNKFTDKEWRMVYRLIEIIKRCNYKEEHMQGLIEMLDILDVGAKGLFSNDRLYRILKDIQKIIA
jgi:transcriptional regulator with XRE-family HTH domain